MDIPVWSTWGKSGEKDRVRAVSSGIEDVWGRGVGRAVPALRRNNFGKWKERGRWCWRLGDFYSCVSHYHLYSTSRWLAFLTHPARSFPWWYFMVSTPQCVFFLAHSLVWLSTGMSGVTLPSSVSDLGLHSPLLSLKSLTKSRAGEILGRCLTAQGHLKQ